MSKYLITGVSGFVGKYFVKYLQEKEPSCEIVGIDRHILDTLSIKYNDIDLNNTNDVNNIIRDYKPDYILHLASMSSVGQSWQEPSICLRDNSNIMLNLLDAIYKNKLNSKILSIGSSEEYGKKENVVLKEDMPLNPENPYAISKVWQEMVCKLYAENFGVNVVMTRSFNHIGPGQSDKFVIPSFMKQLLNIANGAENKMFVGNVEVSRDFTDVRDVVDAYYKLLHYGKSGDVYNVCSGISYKLKEIISIAENILGIKANIEIDKNLIRPNDVMLVQGDNTKLCSELGWKRKYEIKETINDILESMKNCIY